MAVRCDLMKTRDKKQRKMQNINLNYDLMKSKKDWMYRIILNKKEL